MMYIPDEKAECMIITLTVNGREVQAEEGEILLSLARRLGIEIPTLCDHEALAFYGAVVCA